jgi:CobQ/CobB/MinD/ParA nucleotide binding domain
VGASSTGGGASGRGHERTDIAKAKFKATTHMAAGLNSSPNKGMQGRARVAMVGLVITIAQRKGGAGKTTLATQLAVAWARCGARVAALDIDPQGSFSTWVDLRRARLGAKAIGFDFAALAGGAAQWVDDRVGSADLVVIDAPPHAETEARIAVRVPSFLTRNRKFESIEPEFSGRIPSMVNE